MCGRSQFLHPRGRFHCRPARPPPTAHGGRAGRCGACPSSCQCMAGGTRACRAAVGACRRPQSHTGRSAGGDRQQQAVSNVRWPRLITQFLGEPPCALRSGLRPAPSSPSPSSPGTVTSSPLRAHPTEAAAAAAAPTPPPPLDPEKLPSSWPPAPPPAPSTSPAGRSGGGQPRRRPQAWPSPTPLQVQRHRLHPPTPGLIPGSALARRGLQGAPPACPPWPQVDPPQAAGAVQEVAATAAGRA